MTAILLVNSDARRIPLADESVQMVCTSPPYWNLRDYQTATWEGGDLVCDHQKDRSAGISSSTLDGGKSTTNHQKEAGFRDICGKCGAVRIDNQLGLEHTPAEYVAHMVEVFREVWRVLRPDGVVFLNIGDSYFSNGGNREYGSYDGATGRGPAPSARRANVYGTSGKAPGDYQDRDCLCESLCDACRMAYRIGKSHSDNRRAPTPVSLPSASSPEHTVLQSDHLPTSGSVHLGDHNGSANPDFEHSQDHVGGPLPASPVSTIDGSSRQLQEMNSRASNQDGVCLLCGRSLAGCVPASERKNACPCASRTIPASRSDHRASIDDIEEIDGSSAYHRSDKACDLAYPNYTTAYRLKPKDLCMIPARVALALQADGWILRSDIIWSKPNPMPESVMDRPTKAHEYLFLLAKSERYYYDADAIREPASESTIGRWGNRAYQKVNEPEAYQWQNSPIEKRRGNRTGEQSFGTNPAGRNRRTVWTISTESYSGSHYATFPKKLVEPCIRAGSSEAGCCAKCGKAWERVIERGEVIMPIDNRPGRNYKYKDVNQNDIDYGKKKGGIGAAFAFGSIQKTILGWQPICTCPPSDPVPCIVLDPFCGSGTTGVVARKLGRHFVGLDLSYSYLHDQARARLSLDALDEWQNGSDEVETNLAGLPLFGDL